MSALGLLLKAAQDCLEPPSTSVGRYTNDFELVVRASKELEDVLEKRFGAPDGKDSGLHDKISAARTPDGEPLPDALIRRMRFVVTVRNKLVHEREFNALEDRAGFVEAYDAIAAELEQLAPSGGGGGGGGGGCAVM